jgi:predicted nucleic acid-binding protein
MAGSFVDTNVLVYAYDSDEPAKQARANEVLRQLGQTAELVLSTQVLQELYITVTRKLARPLAEADALEAVREWSRVPVVQVDPPLILAAAETSRFAVLSFWDALVLEAAALRGCARLLSEDLQDGFVHKGVRVENPFVGL